MIRKAIIVVSLALGLFIVITTGLWIRDHYVASPRSEIAQGRFRHPGYRDMGVDAVRRFASLEPSQQALVRENLERNVRGVGEWLADLQMSGFAYLCLGEDHEEATRDFLARRFFTEVDVDVLLLEVTPHNLWRLTQELRWGRNHVALLDADIAAIIRAARARNPELTIAGIEETKAQRLERQAQAKPGLRDTSISPNFWQQFRYGKRHVVLFGALHCSHKPNWFYERTRRLGPRRIAQQMSNARILDEHHNGPVEAFVYFLDEIGVRRGDFVIAETTALHPLIYEWFDLLGVMLENFAVLVVFRE